MKKIIIIALLFTNCALFKPKPVIFPVYEKDDIKEYTLDWVFIK